jgi:hypothetical protein
MYTVGQEITVVCQKFGSTTTFGHHVVVKVGVNSVVLDDGRTFLQNGKLRGTKDGAWKDPPYLLSREDGLIRETNYNRLKKLENLLPEYRKRWQALDAKYPLWIPEMREKAREFVAWLDGLDLD